MRVNRGDLYALKRGNLDYILRIEEVTEQGRIRLREIDADSNDMKIDLTIIQPPYRNIADFLSKYEKITSKELKEFLLRLRERQEVIAQKINFLEQSAQASQTSPKCTSRKGRRYGGDDAMLGDHIGRHSHPLPGDY